MQSTIVYEYIYKLKDHENKIKNLKNRFDVWHNKTDNINIFKENTWEKIDKVEKLIKNMKNRFNDVQEKHVQMNALAQDILKIQNNHLNEESNVLYQECQDDILNLKMLKPLLEELSNGTEEKEGILHRINPDYIDAFVIPAQKHAENLTKISQSYKK